MKCPYCQAEEFVQIKLTSRLIKEVDEDFFPVTFEEEKTLYLVLKCNKCRKLLNLRGEE